MSTITISEDSEARQQTSKTYLESDQKQEQAWHEFGLALGFPEFWVSLLREGLESNGRTLRWQHLQQ